MNLYKITYAGTGATIFVVAKSPKNARTLVANKFGEDWDDTSIATVQQFKPTGSTPRILIGPLYEDSGVPDPELEEDDAPELAPVGPLLTLENVIDGAFWHIGSWVQDNPVKVRDFFKKIGLA